MATASKKDEEAIARTHADADALRMKEEALAMREEALEREIALSAREAVLEERMRALEERLAGNAPAPIGEHKIVEKARELIQDLFGKSGHYNGQYERVTEEFHLPQLGNKGPLVRTQGRPVEGAIEIAEGSE